MAFGGIFIALGSIGFFLRRSDRIWNTLTMVVISFNSYPIFDALGHPLKWLFLLAPLTAVGVIPSRYLLRPDFETLAAELVAAVLIAIGGVLIFRTGLRRYQSTPTFVGQRL